MGIVRAVIGISGGLQRATSCYRNAVTFRFSPAEYSMKAFLLAAFTAALLSGCGVMATPCRVASAGLKMVPLIGGIAALPTDGCAAVID